jgi:DNA-binding transcriptional LysR family regulator
MDLRRLRYFIAVAEEPSFNRAAQRLRIAQPPLSNQIKQLEVELGVVLFERTSRGVRMTEAGELLLEEARRIFVEVDQTVRIVQRVGHGEVGRLVLGFVPSASNEVLPPILHAFRERFPEVELFLREMRPNRVVQLLHEKQIDVGFLYLPLEDASLNIECVSREPLVLALPEAEQRRILFPQSRRSSYKPLLRNRSSFPHATRCPVYTAKLLRSAAKRASLPMRSKKTSGSCRQSLVSSPGV